MDKLATITDKLEQLRAADPACTIFGAAQHKYGLNPCLSAAEVARFEADQRVTLPPDYRRFVLEVGNGGAGPYYGLHPLDRAVDASCLDKDPRILSKPFPLEEVLIMWQCAGATTLDEHYERQETDAKYHRAVTAGMRRINSCSYSRGALYLGDYGCGIAFLLIVTGAERGNMWVDDRVNNGGLFPLTHQANAAVHTDFLAWYENWLDAGLRQVAGTATESNEGYFEFG